MNTPDFDVLTTLQQWLDAQRACVLVTVAKTWGSSPRAVGSLMCIRQDGAFKGSVSGGCVEDDLIEKIKSFDFSKNKPRVIKYGENKTHSQRFDLPCESVLELVIENISSANQIKPALTSLKTRTTMSRRLNLTSGEVTFLPIEGDKRFSYDKQYLQKTFGPTLRLIIIGATHLSKHLAQMAQPLGYEIVICDPRKEYLLDWDVKDTVMDSRMPDEVVMDLGNDKRSAIVTLTHDPKLDDMALMQALDSNAFYVGALGSKKNNNKRRQRMTSLGVSKQGIERLHGPVGLPIGSHTPPEIAIAILAEIIAISNYKSTIKYRPNSGINQEFEEIDYA